MRASEYSRMLCGWLPDWNKVLAGFAVLLSVQMSLAFSQQTDQQISAQQTFKFVANTLQAHGRSGSISESIGVPATDTDDFIALLESSYEGFSRDFSPTSSFCRVYQDPNNAIMEIEQRAQLAFQYLPNLSVRVARYIKLEQEFESQVRAVFGDSVWQNIERLKPQTTSFEYLPTFELNGGDIVNFADTACR